VVLLRGGMWSFCPSATDHAMLVRINIAYCHICLAHSDLRRWATFSASDGSKRPPPAPGRRGSLLSTTERVRQFVGRSVQRGAERREPPRSQVGASGSRTTGGCPAWVLPSATRALCPRPHTTRPVAQATGWRWPCSRSVLLTVDGVLGTPGLVGDVAARLALLVLGDVRSTARELASGHVGHLSVAGNEGVLGHSALVLPEEGVGPLVARILFDGAASERAGTSPRCKVGTRRTGEIGCRSVGVRTRST
jgi:hypothetical protein